MTDKNEVTARHWSFIMDQPLVGSLWKDSDGEHIRVVEVRTKRVGEARYKSYRALGVRWYPHPDCPDPRDEDHTHTAECGWNPEPDDTTSKIIWRREPRRGIGIDYRWPDVFVPADDPVEPEPAPRTRATGRGHWIVNSENRPRAGSRWVSEEGGEDSVAVVVDSTQEKHSYRPGGYKLTVDLHGKRGEPQRFDTWFYTKNPRAIPRWKPDTDKPMAESHWDYDTGAPRLGSWWRFTTKREHEVQVIQQAGDWAIIAQDRDGKKFNLSYSQWAIPNYEAIIDKPAGLDADRDDDVAPAADESLNDFLARIDEVTSS